MLIGQVPVIEMGIHSYSRNLYSRLWESKRIEESMYQVFYMIGYMVTRVTLF